MSFPCCRVKTLSRIVCFLMAGQAACGAVSARAEGPESSSAEALVKEGVQVLADARQERNATVRLQLLNEARVKLESVLAKHGDDPACRGVPGQLATLLVERARIRGAAADRKPAPERTAARRGVATEYEEALAAFVRHEGVLRKKLESLPQVDPESTELIQQRTMLRADYLQAQMLRAATLEESSDFYDDEQRAAKLQEARQQYRAVHDKYRTRLVGLFALLYECRCHRKLGDVKSAESGLRELLSQPRKPDALAMVAVKAQVELLELWTDSRSPQWRKAAVEGRGWLDGEQLGDSDRAAMRKLVRVAYARLIEAEQDAPARQKLIDELKEIKSGGKSPLGSEE